ncbi:MAG: BON domain-containing protein [Gammaproteobacteria bacterium]|nr:BON domain-containing protein [Gammaproteobacteria bacterium]MBU1444403.1 BON domain-containing protein [Gammaproteobacteria bacterium]MBU2285566.1 BON domain-containing protein [Gammaproteobacteria bacterium]MBU2408488.1 BON domain-containing protein [Gammaproteobacteria bacterium]
MAGQFESLRRTGSAPRSGAALWTACAAVAAAMLLTACDNANDNRTPGQKLDSAVEKTEDAAGAAARKAAELAETARDKTKAYLDSPQAKQDAAAAKDAVKNAGSALMNTVDDATITASVSTGLARDAELSATKIDVDTKHGAVTLSGPAPSAPAKARAGAIAAAVQGVISVDNRLEVSAGPPAGRQPQGAIDPPGDQSAGR